MKCLGIECTAHTAGIAIVDDKGNVLENIKDMYITSKGGIIPDDAAKHHKKVFPELFKKIKNDFDLISAAGAWYTCDFLVENPKPIKKLLEAEGIKEEEEEKIIKFVKFQGQNKLKDFLDTNDLWPSLQNSLKEMLF